MLLPVSGTLFEYIFFLAVRIHGMRVVAIRATPKVNVRLAGDDHAPILEMARTEPPDCRRLAKWRATVPARPSGTIVGTLMSLRAGSGMEIREDDVRGVEILALLEAHLAAMARESPPESRHALDPEGLRAPEVTMWTAWEGGELLGCGALKEIAPDHGEIKSMRTAETHLRRGVGTRILEHLIEEARRRSYRRLSLETGCMAAFEPARRLYLRFGFEPCGPFADYRVDPNSVYMTMAL